MPAGVIYASVYMHLSAILCLVMGAAIVIGGRPALDTESQLYIVGAFLLLAGLYEILAIGLQHRSAWARIGAVAVMILGLPSIIYLVPSLVGLLCLFSPRSQDWFDPDYRPEHSPTSVPAVPRQLVGGTCLGCGERITADYEAEACTRCACPVHKACRAANNGCCSRCGHIEQASPANATQLPLPQTPDSTPPLVPSLPTKLPRQRINRPLVGSRCAGCDEEISHDLDAVLCRTCGNPIHKRCTQYPTDTSCPECGIETPLQD